MHGWWIDGGGDGDGDGDDDGDGPHVKLYMLIHKPSKSISGMNGWQDSRIPGFRTRCFQFHMSYLSATFYMHDVLYVTSIVKYILHVQCRIGSPHVYFVS